MRKITYTVAVLATACLITPVTAEDDFAALLADLSFGDVELMDETLAVTSAEPAGDLRPAPHLFEMPAEPAAPSNVVSLQSPVAADQPNSDEQLDLEAAFAVQEQDGIQVQSVGHAHNHYQCDCETSGCASCGHGAHGYECIPHEMPMLPGMTFYQAFRSNRCHIHVWDNYRQKCCAANKHVLGTCDCYKHGSGWSCNCGNLLGKSSHCGGKCCDTQCDGSCDAGCKTCN